ncbi:putative secreted protein [Klebsiella pneumoniae]|nr:putative secreted protein [Klebsiella pneumoniae]
MRNSLSVALFTLMLSPLAAFAQQQFATPEQAATALAEAISQPNEAALSEVLGDNWQQFLPTDGIDPAAVDRFQRDWQVKHVIIQQGGKAWLDVGSEAWRLPVPIVKTSEGWRFDMAAGEEEILTRASAAMSFRRSPPCMPMLMPSRIIII